MSKEALRHLHSRGMISDDSFTWAPGMTAAQRLVEVRELRWMLSRGLGLLGPFDAALVALKVGVRVLGGGGCLEGGGAAASCIISVC